jgi:transcriptional regulator with XRE-family HTH domain
MVLVHNMRSSSKQTTVAVIRSELGLSIEEFGKLIGKAPSTIKALEAKNRLTLSEETAAAISEATGVSLAWLLEGNPRKRMSTVEGEPYTREVYEMLSGRREDLVAKLQIPTPSPKPRGWMDLNNPQVLFMRGLVLCSHCLPAYSAAIKAGKREVAEHMIFSFVKQMLKRFGNDSEFDRFMGMLFQHAEEIFDVKNSPSEPAPANARPKDDRKSS